MSSDLLKELISGIKLESLPNDDLQILGDILEEIICKNNSVLSMLLNKKTNITIKNIKEANNIDAIIPELGEGVSSETNFEAGIEGSNLLFFQNKAVITFANSVMGADDNSADENVEIGQLHISAFGEIISQFTAKITTALTTCLETKIGALSPSIKQQNGKELDTSDALKDCPIILISYQLDLDENNSTTLFQILSLSLVYDIIDKFKQAQVPDYNISKNYSGNRNSAISNEAAGSQQPGVTVKPVKFSPFDSIPDTSNAEKNLDLLMDIKLKLTVELGRTEMPIKKVLELSRGSVIELNKIAGEPVELLANGKLIATGEVVVIDDNFGLRITNIISPDSRLKNL